MHTHPAHTLGREEACKRATKEQAKIAGVKVLKTIGLGFSDGTATIHASQADTSPSQFTAILARTKAVCVESSHKLRLRNYWCILAIGSNRNVIALELAVKRGATDTKHSAG